MGHTRAVHLVLHAYRHDIMLHAAHMLPRSPWRPVLQGPTPYPTLPYTLPRCLSAAASARSSRKGTADTAQHLLADSMRGGPPGRFVRDRAQQERMQAAAERTASRPLQDALRGGVGFHHAAMDAQDRALVEACFLDRSILARGPLSAVLRLPCAARCACITDTGLGWRPRPTLWYPVHACS